MRIAIDARPAVFPRRTGVGTYTRQLLRLLPRADPDSSFVAWYLNARRLGGGPGRLLEEIGGPNLVERPTPIPARLFEVLSERYDLPRIEWFARFDVLFAPNFVPPPTRSPRVVVTVHDLAFKRFPQTAPHGTRRWLDRLAAALDRAARIIVVSESTRADLIELFGVDAGRIVVTHLGVDEATFRPSPEGEVRVRRRFGIDRPYLLFLGGIEPRKNLPGLLEAFARLPRDLEVGLVIVGGGVEWNPEGSDVLRASLDRLAREVRARVRLTGYVTEADKVALLGGAAAFVYPSWYEGFGLPILEAMACGTPVVTSNVSALPEVAGDAAVLVDPADPGAIAAAVERVLSDSDLGARLRAAGIDRARGFTWEETARRTAAVLREVGG